MTPIYTPLHLVTPFPDLGRTSFKSRAIGANHGSLSISLDPYHTLSYLSPLSASTCPLPVTTRGTCLSARCSPLPAEVAYDVDIRRSTGYLERQVLWFALLGTDENLYKRSGNTIRSCSTFAFSSSSTHCDHAITRQLEPSRRSHRKQSKPEVHQINADHRQPARSTGFPCRVTSPDCRLHRLNVNVGSVASPRWSPRRC